MRHPVYFWVHIRCLWKFPNQKLTADFPGAAVALTNAGQSTPGQEARPDAYVGKPNGHGSYVRAHNPYSPYTEPSGPGIHNLDRSSDAVLGRGTVGWSPNDPPKMGAPSDDARN